MDEGAESPSGSSRKQQVSRRAQKLSEERLARKRELDRQAQRSARVKTKNHIAHLESRIEALTKVQGSGDVRGLIEQIEEQRKENEALKTTLKAIGKLVGNTGNTSTTGETKTEVEEEKAHDSPDTDDLSHERIEQTNGGHFVRGRQTPSSDLVRSTNGVCLGISDSDIIPNAYLDALFPDSKPKSPKFPASFSIPTAENLVHTAQLLGGQSVIQPDWRANPSDCCCRAIRVGNDLLLNCSKLHLQHTASTRLRDEDIAIRAVINGWNAVTERHSLDPVWQTLRQADVSMFSKCGSMMERLVCLAGVCLQLRYRVSPTEQNREAVPYFVRERPSQRAIPHHPLIDYLVWPGLRERLVFNPHCYCSDKFENMFWPSFRFTWGHQFREAYSFNNQTGLYQFSALFLERTRDLQCYRMTSAFFEDFPELKADIQMAIPEPDPADFNFDNGLGSFGLAGTPDLSSMHNVFMDGDGFTQVHWQPNQANMRVDKV